MKSLNYFLWNKKGQAATQESMMVPIQIILGAGALLLLLGIAVSLFLIFTPGQDDIAQAQFENFVLNVQSVGNDPRGFLTRTVQFDLEDGYLIALFDKELETSHGKFIQSYGHNIDDCRSPGILVKPERAVGSVNSLPEDVEADPQCFRRACACLYKTDGNDLSYRSAGLSDQPERIRCLPIDGIDTSVTFTQRASAPRILAYTGELESELSEAGASSGAVSVVTTKVNAIEWDIENDLTDIDDELTFLASDLLGYSSNLEDNGYNPESLAQGIRMMANSFSSILGGSKIPHYPDELIERNDLYGDVFIYGKCNERTITQNTEVANMYLEKYKYTDAQGKQQTTLFLALASPLTEDRKEDIQDIIISSAKRVGDSAFAQKRFRAARENYEQLSTLDFPLQELAPEIEYKLAYTYWQTFNEEEALSRFEQLANKNTGHFGDSIYRMYAQLMIGRIHEYLAEKSLSPTQSKNHLESAQEAYAAAVAMFAPWGSEKPESWDYSFDAEIVRTLADREELNAASESVLEFGFEGQAPLDRSEPGFWRSVLSTVGLADTSEEVTLQRTVSLLSVHAGVKLADLLAQSGEINQAYEVLDAILRAEDSLDALVDPLRISIQMNEGFATLQEADAFISPRADPESLINIVAIQNVIARIDWSLHPSYSWIQEDVTSNFEALIVEAPEGMFPYGDTFVAEDVLIPRLASLYVEAGIYSRAIQLLESWPETRMESNQTIRALSILADVYERTDNDAAADVYALLATLDPSLYDHEGDLVPALVLAASYFADEGLYGETRGAAKYVNRISELCEVAALQGCDSKSRADFLLAELALSEGSYENARIRVSPYLDSEDAELSAHAHYLTGISHIEEGDAQSGISFLVQIQSSNRRTSSFARLALDSYVDYCRRNSQQQVCSGYEIYRRSL